MSRWRSLRGFFSLATGGDPSDVADPSMLARPIDLDSIRSAVGEVSAISSDSGPAFRSEALELLDAIREGVALVVQAVADSPPGYIRGEVWISGSELSQMLGELAEVAFERGDVLVEERARGLTVAVIHAIAGHYPAINLDVMLAAADSSTRLGDLESAGLMYQEMIRHYGEIVRPFVDGETDLDRDTAQAIAYLCVGAERAAELDRDWPEGVDIPRLLKDCEAVSDMRITR